MATKFARAIKFAKDTGGETRKANYLSTRVGDRQEPEVGTQGREKADMVLVVDAAGGHYRDHRELRVLGEWGWRGSVWSVKCGVWGVEGGGWSGGEVRSGKVRGSVLAGPAFGTGERAVQLGRLSRSTSPSTFRLPPLFF